MALMIILTAKYEISTPLIMENPVNSPIVPPTAASLVSKFAFSSLVILSNIEVSKRIFTQYSLVSEAEKGETLLSLKQNRIILGICKGP